MRERKRFPSQDGKTKRCPSHDGGKGAILPISDFHLDANALDGHQGYCKACLCAKARGRYARRGPSISTLYSVHRGRARRVGCKSSISVSEFQRLIEMPCAYGGATRPTANIGIDRKDPKGDYTVANVVPCCPRHNSIKQDVFSFDSMMLIVKEFPEARACGNQFRVKPRKFTPGPA